MKRPIMTRWLIACGSVAFTLSTTTLLAQTAEHAVWGTRFSLTTAAWAIAAGSLLTAATRTMGLAKRLEACP